MNFRSTHDTETFSRQAESYFNVVLISVPKASLEEMHIQLLRKFAWLDVVIISVHIPFKLMKLSLEDEPFLRSSLLVKLVRKLSAFCGTRRFFTVYTGGATGSCPEKII
jgi:hypothetical protein